MTNPWLRTILVPKDPDSEDWECLVCEFDKAESGGLAKPIVCPLCLLDNGTFGRIVTRRGKTVPKSSS